MSVDGHTPEDQALQALLDWLRPLTTNLGPDDVLVLQAPPSLPPAGAVQLHKLISLGVREGAIVQLLDAAKRVQLVRLPATMPVRMQTTDLRDAGRP